MESSIPFGLRVAAGLFSEALGALRRLPSDVTALPVTVLGRVAKLSFQLNQQLSELATEGDHLLASLAKSEAPPERTAWSTIDDEDEVAAKDPQAAPTWDSVEEAADEPSRPDYAEPVVTFDDPLDDRVDRVDTIDTLGAAGAADTLGAADTDGFDLVGDGFDPIVVGFDAVADADLDTTGAATTESDTDTDTIERTLIEDVDQLEGDVHQHAGAVDELVSAIPPISLVPPLAESVAVADAPVAGSPTLTLAQLRSKIKSMSVEQVRAALQHEESHRARPAHLTMLTNRLSTLARGGE